MHASFTAILLATVSLGFFPRTSCQWVQHCCGLPDTLVDFGIEGQVVARVVADGGTKVSVLMDNIQFIAVDGNNKSWPSTLVSFRLMVSPKSLQAWENLSMRHWSCCSVSEVTARHQRRACL